MDINVPIDTLAIKMVDGSATSTTMVDGCDWTVIIVIALALVAALAVRIRKFTEFQKRYVSSDKLNRQIIGSLLEWNCAYFWTLIVLIIPLSLGVSLVISPKELSPIILLVGLNLLLWLMVKTCRRLLDIFSLRKKDTAITWCYITVLLSMGIWVVCFLLIFNIKQDGKTAAAMAVIGLILSWVFQDKIKGVVAFLHLRMHHLLNIGDWIQVPEKDVDGEVKKVTLTSVSISNWDTTTSVIPISMLHADHFINLQNMMLGKTYGRRMLKSFVFDTSWFCTLSAEAIRKIEADHSIDLHLTDEEIGKGILNAKVFRQYLYHWLMNHSHISQLPRLIVRWLEHEGNGMPLQVYAFIIDSTLAAFEWQQSQIMEHIIESAAWFNMQLFQEASAFDVSNSNIYLTKQPAPYRKEELQ